MNEKRKDEPCPDIVFVAHWSKDRFGKQSFDAFWWDGERVKAQCFYALLSEHVLKHKGLGEAVLVRRDHTDVDLTTGDIRNHLGTVIAKLKR